MFFRVKFKFSLPVLFLYFAYFSFLVYGYFCKATWVVKRNQDLQLLQGGKLHKRTCKWEESFMKGPGSGDGQASEVG
jgi:hypothetical protein